MKKLALLISLICLNLHAASDLDPKTLAGEYQVGECSFGLRLNSAEVTYTVENKVAKLTFTIVGSEKVEKEILLGNGERSIPISKTSNQMVSEKWNTIPGFQSLYQTDTIRNGFTPTSPVLGYSIRNLSLTGNTLKFHESQYRGISGTPFATHNCYMFKR